MSVRMYVYQRKKAGVERPRSTWRYYTYNTFKLNNKQLIDDMTYYELGSMSPTTHVRAGRPCDK